MTWILFDFDSQNRKLEIGQNSTYSGNGWLVSWRKVCGNLIRVSIEQTFDSIPAYSNALVVAGLPFVPAFNQDLYAIMCVGYQAVQTEAYFTFGSNAAAYLTCKEYGANITVKASGFLVVN